MVSFVLYILADRLGEKKKIKDSMLNYLKNKKAEVWPWQKLLFVLLWKSSWQLSSNFVTALFVMFLVWGDYSLVSTRKYQQKGEEENPMVPNPKLLWFDILVAQRISLTRPNCHEWARE